MLDMVNATIQHEICNPLNSIHCQTVVISKIKRMLDNLIVFGLAIDVSQLQKKNKTTEHFNKKLLAIRTLVAEAMNINISSEKLVSFLIKGC